MIATAEDYAHDADTSLDEARSLNSQVEGMDPQAATFYVQLAQARALEAIGFALVGILRHLDGER
jgi:hypothetical protein